MAISERVPAGEPMISAVRVSGEKRSYIEWPAVWAGALVAAAVSLVLTTFGVAIGLAVASPWLPRGPTPQTGGLIAAAWLAFTYIWSFGVGGYLAGRMRPIAGDAWQSERGFRDGVNGLVVWAIGVWVGAVLVALAVGGGMELTGNPGATAAIVPEATDATRRTAAFAGFWSALVLLLSAVVAWFASCWGGQHRDRSTIA